MAKEANSVSLVILGITAIIAVVGLVLLFTGNTGNVALETRSSGAICAASGEQACARGLACEGGKGGILLGITNTHYKCICDEHLLPETLGQWGSFRTAANGLAYNPDHIKLIAQCRTY